MSTTRGKGKGGGTGANKFTLDAPPPPARPAVSLPGVAPAALSTPPATGPSPQPAPAESHTGGPSSSSASAARQAAPASAGEAAAAPKPTGAASLPGRRAPKQQQSAAPASSNQRQSAASGGRKFSQHNRLFWIDTPFGADKVLIRSMRGSEEISGLFQFHLDLVSDDENLDFDQIIGRNVTFSIKQSDDVSERFFNGHVIRFRQRNSEGRLAQYEAEVAPYLWFLTKTSDCFIFQKQNVVEVVEQIFHKYGLRHYEKQLQMKYTPWEYCVQYRESAFQFVSRLLEAEGIFYFFKHEKGKHTLVLADTPSAHKPCPYQSEFRLERAFGAGVLRGEDTIFDWQRQRQVRSARYTHTEYNYEKPSANLRVEKRTRFQRSREVDWEVYDYPGEYEKREDGDFWGTFRMEEEEFRHDEARGESNCRSMIPGFRFTLRDHTRKDQDGDYFLTRLEHEGEEGAFASGIDSGRARYRNRFECAPYPSPFRPPRRTRKPLMRGSQTAMVVGPPGEEIYVDKYGCVKVQFHWDREGKRNEHSSCFIRVAQPWAGDRWGAMWIPRIGQEVIVDFLEGDPDRPIITGRVYNAEQMPPYELPRHQTRSTFKSRSSKGGGPANYNEIRFEDKKDEEQLYIHAERDMDWSVERDSRELVGRDHHTLVRRDEIEKVEGERHSRIDKDHRLAIGGDLSLQIGGGHHEKAGEVVVIEAGRQIHLKAGSAIVLESGHISFRGSGGFVDVGPGGIVIQGTMVDINPPGAQAPAPGASLNLRDPRTPDKAEEDPA